MSRRGWLLAALAALACFVLALGTAGALVRPASSSITGSPSPARAIGAAPDAEPPAGASTPSVATPPPATASPPSAAPAPAPPATVGKAGVLCVGDSVMLGASSAYLSTLTSCGTVDAKVGRQMAAGTQVLRSHQPLPAEVVVHLGTNGPVRRADLESLLAALGGRRVVLVTVQLNGSRPWESQSNSEIMRAAGAHSNVRIADWKSVSKGHPEYFGGDHIHLAAAGARAYAAVIATAL